MLDNFKVVLIMCCQSREVNGVSSIPVWSGGMDFEEIGQK